MKINLKELVIYHDIAKTNRQTIDASEAFANILYSHVNGIRAHSLAMAIYHSEGVLDITDKDAELITTVVNQFCTPAFIDAINTQINTWH